MLAAGGVLIKDAKVVDKDITYDCTRQKLMMEIIRGYKWGYIFRYAIVHNISG